MTQKECSPVCGTSYRSAGVPSWLADSQEAWLVEIAPVGSELQGLRLSREKRLLRGSIGAQEGSTIPQLR